MQDLDKSLVVTPRHDIHQSEVYCTSFKSITAFISPFPSTVVIASALSSILTHLHVNTPLTLIDFFGTENSYFIKPNVLTFYSSHNFTRFASLLIPVITKIPKFSKFLLRFPISLYIVKHHIRLLNLPRIKLYLYHLMLFARINEAVN